MKKKLFQQIFLASLAVLLLTVGVLFFFVVRNLHAENISHLQSEMELAEAALAAGNEALENTDSRIQLISADGEVLFDSARYHPEFRPEEQPEYGLALRDGEGWDTRSAGEVTRQQMSYAHRLEDGSVLIVSDQTYNGYSLFLQLFTPLLGLILIIVFLAAVMANHGAKLLTEPLDRIDFSRPDERDVEDEIKPLVRRLAEQNRLIRQQMDDLAEEHARQDKYRREFTANVSHELKTPLTSISGFAELIRDGMAKPEDVPRFAGKIHDECRRLIDLVGDIIRLSRLDDGAVHPEKEWVDLNEVAEQTLEQLENSAQRRQVSLQLRQTDEVRIFAVRQMLEEIFYNLCDNAIKYNRPGGSVNICIQAETDAAVLSVSDTGIGIPPDDVPRIFERFYRVDKSHSREAGGTGLGLSIVKHCAMYHRAEICVFSEPGSGTEIRVRFPWEKGGIC